MGKEKSVGLERALEAAIQMQKAEMDRRQLFLRAAALGAAGALGFTARPAMHAFAQDTDKNELVTISQDQQQVWVKNFNPFLSAGSVRWPTHWGIHEPLLIFNALTGETVPWLAESWEWSADALTLTFKIRTGVKWSDGEAFSAQDALFTFQHFIDHADLPGEGGGRQALDNFVSKVAAPDDTTAGLYPEGGIQPGAVGPRRNQHRADAHLEGHRRSGHGHERHPGRHRPLHRDSDLPGSVLGTARQPELLAGRQAGKSRASASRPSRATMPPTWPTVGGETDWFANFIPDIDNAFVAKDPEHNHYFQPADRRRWS